MLTRRQMLERSMLLSLSPIVPAFLARTARAAGVERDRRVLVVVQLDGGNDGLNTVVPSRDDNYARLRPKLQLKKESLVKLNDELGLHESMKAAGKLFDDGRLAIVQGVGYPNPNRSHFRSMAIWQSARTDEADHGQYGWLGRALDAAGAGSGPQAVFTGLGSPPVTLWSRRSTVAAMASLDELALDAPAAMLRAAATPAGETSELASFVSRMRDEAFTSSERLSTLVDAPASSGATPYGQSNIAQQLKLISTLLKAESPARVFYAVQSGYDTHATQAFEHSRLLRAFSDGIKAFLDDMAASGLADRVLVLAFSEFGRRAAENDSLGTDHGAAGPVFVAGPKFARGIIGPAPDLANLDDGDVKMAIDFRQVYATILDRWLEVPSGEILAGSYEHLDLIGT